MTPDPNSVQSTGLTLAEVEEEEEEEGERVWGLNDPTSMRPLAALTMCS